MQFPSNGQPVGLYPGADPSYHHSLGSLYQSIDSNGNPVDQSSLGPVQSTFSSVISKSLADYQELNVAHLDNNLPGFRTEDYMAELVQGTWMNDPLYGSEYDTSVQNDDFAIATLGLLASAQSCLEARKKDLISSYGGNGFQVCKALNELSSKLGHLQNGLYARDDGINDDAVSNVKSEPTSPRATMSASPVISRKEKVYDKTSTVPSADFVEDGDQWKISSSKFAASCKACTASKTKCRFTTQGAATCRRCVTNGSECQVAEKLKMGRKKRI